MAKLRSCLNHVGNAELKLIKSEVNRIDKDVGLAINNNTDASSAIFDTCALEWSTTNRKELKRSRQNIAVSATPI